MMEDRKLASVVSKPELVMPLLTNLTIFLMIQDPIMRVSMASATVGANSNAMSIYFDANPATSVVSISFLL